jgi:membrane-associated phospholipid phosphatase
MQRLHTVSDPVVGPLGPSPLAYGLGCLAALLLVLLGVALQGTPCDRAVLLAVNEHSQAAATGWSMLTVSGLGLSVFILCTAAAWGVQASGRLALAALLWCFVLGGVVTHGLKKVFDLARPAAVLAPEQLQIIGERLVHGSMPSGHSLTAGAAVTIALACWQLPWPARLGVVVWGLLVGLSRNAVAAHWPSDVCVGLGLGVLVALASVYLARRPGLRDGLARPWAQRLLGVGQVVAGLSMLGTQTGYPLAIPLQWGLAALAVGAGVWRLWLSRPPAPAGGA